MACHLCGHGIVAECSLRGGAKGTTKTHGRLYADFRRGDTIVHSSGRENFSKIWLRCQRYFHGRLAADQFGDSRRGISARLHRRRRDHFEPSRRQRSDRDRFATASPNHRWLGSAGNQIDCRSARQKSWRDPFWRVDLFRRSFDVGVGLESNRARLRLSKMAVSASPSRHSRAVESMSA